MQKMYKTDLGPRSTSKMEVALKIINGSPINAKSLVLAKRVPDLSSVTEIIVIL